jgi:hypothetical protein
MTNLNQKRDEILDKYAVDHELFPTETLALHTGWNLCEKELGEKLEIAIYALKQCARDSFPKQNARDALIKIGEGK